MRLIKYDGVSDKSIKAILSSGIGSSSNNTDSPSRGDSSSLERTIWGQNDVGDDIDGTSNWSIHSGNLHREPLKS